MGVKDMIGLGIDHTWLGKGKLSTMLIILDREVVGLSIDMIVTTGLEGSSIRIVMRQWVCVYLKVLIRWGDRLIPSIFHFRGLDDILIDELLHIMFEMHAYISVMSIYFWNWQKAFGLKGDKGFVVST